MNIQGYTMCEVFLDYMQCSGCDKTSAFVRKGKVKPYNILVKHTVKVLDLEPHRQSVRKFINP